MNGYCVRGEPIDCDDGIECTEDICDETTKSCIHIPHDELCDDNNPCNGIERCAPEFYDPDPDLSRTDERGCLHGIPKICDDGDDCTKDYCDPVTGECKIALKDSDGDGHGDEDCSLCDTNGDGLPDKSCRNCTDSDPMCIEIERGDDCNDNSDQVYPGHSEICGDGLDNDCDRKIDVHDDECSPQNDTCNEVIEILSEGEIIGSTRGVNDDYASSCAPDGSVDVVYMFTLTEAHDVDIRVTGAPSYLSLMTECGDIATEITCNLANIFYFNLQPGTYYLIVDSPEGGNFRLQFTLDAPTTPPDNDTCDNAIDIVAGHLVTGTTYGSNDNTDAYCASDSARDVFYHVQLAEPHDVIVTARGVGGVTSPWVEIRRDCNDPSTAIRCGRGDEGVRAYNIQPGDIYIVVEGEGRGGDFELEVAFEDPTPVINVGSNMTCDSPTVIDSEAVVAGTFNSNNNRLDLTCGYSNYEEVVFQLNLAQPQDIVINLIEGNIYRAGIRTDCNDSSTELMCNTESFPMRFLGVEAGSYYLIFERDGWSNEYDFMISIEFQPPTPSFNVDSNDTCATAYDITVDRGVFRGSTSGMDNDYQASCGGDADSPDAVFHLSLTQRSNVILSLQGSSYDTVLFVREGQCDDQSREIDCNDDYYGLQSYLEFTGQEALDPGDYYIFVDGFSSYNSGNYQLYVEVNPI